MFYRGTSTGLLASSMLTEAERGRVVIGPGRNFYVFADGIKMRAQGVIRWGWADTMLECANIIMSGNEKFLLVVAMRDFPRGLVTEEGVRQNIRHIPEEVVRRLRGTCRVGSQNLKLRLKFSVQCS